MEFHLNDRLHDGAIIKFMNNKVIPSYLSEHHDYHPHFEISYNYHNRPVNILLNNHTIRVAKPCIVIYSPFTIHCMSPCDTNYCFDFHVLFFNKGILPSDDKLLPLDFLAKYSNCIFPLTFEQNEHLLFLLRLFTINNANNLEIRSYFLSFINSLFRMVPESNRISIEKSDVYIPEILNYIYKNITQLKSSEEIAKTFHISLSKLNRDFKNMLGLSVHKIIINRRITYAIDLLTNTNMKIKQIAIKCGFENEYYFYSFFKKQTNHTPSFYRT